MEKVNEILKNKEYKKYLKELYHYEKDREFCNHTLEHFLDLSRIAYIKVLEENLKISKEVIYAIGLLHDIGRVLEYREGTPHHIGSLIISKEILKDTTFNKEEIKLILEGIENHRKDSVEPLWRIIYESDKLSRNCFSCKVERECKWNKEKKNFEISY